MKLFLTKFSVVLASLAMMLVTISANACAGLAYQPELPDSVKKLRKF